MEEDFVKTAKKYLPSLTQDQEDLVRRIAKCPNHNGQNAKAIMWNKEGMYQKCFCSLDLLSNLYKLKEKIRLDEEKRTKEIVNNNPYLKSESY